MSNAGPRSGSWMGPLLLLLLGLAAAATLAHYWSLRRPPTGAPIRIGMQDSPPWYYFDEKQVISGPVHEIIEEAARRRRLGLIWVSDPAGPDHALASGTVDVWPLMGRLPDRLTRYEITDSWLELSYALCTRTACANEKYESRAVRAIAHKGGEVMRWMLRGPLAQAEQVVLGSHAEALRAVCAGKADAAIITETAHYGGLSVVPDECRKNKVCLRTTPLETIGFGVGSRPGAVEARAAAIALRNELDRMIDDGTMPGILLRWGVPSGEVRALRSATLASTRARVMSFIALGLVGAVIALSVVSRRLLIAKREGERVQAELRRSKHALQGEFEKRREIETRLYESERLESLGRLAGGVAHDFNNLLTVIRGFSDLLLTEVQTGSRMHRFIEEIASAGARGAELTRQLLAYSRSQESQLEPLSLNSIITGMQSLLCAMAGDKTRIEISLTDHEDSIAGDRGQIGRMLMNLVVNARDAMPDGGVIRIETSQRAADAPPGDQRLVVLTVSDTGHGMDEETRSRIFEPFFTTKPKGVGTGMGLSIVQAVAHGLGGWVEVSSTPGEGSIFRVLIPALSADQAGASSSR